MAQTTSIRRSHPVDILLAESRRGSLVASGSQTLALAPDPNGVLDAQGRLWVPWSMARWAAHHAQAPAADPQALWLVRQQALLGLRLLPASRLAVETIPYSLYDHRDGAWQRCIGGSILGRLAAGAEAAVEQPWLALAEAGPALQEVIRTVGAKVNVGVRNMTLNFGSF